MNTLSFRCGSNYFVQLLAGDRALLEAEDLIVVEATTNDVADIGAGPAGASVKPGDTASSDKAIQVCTRFVDRVGGCRNVLGFVLVCT